MRLFNVAVGWTVLACAVLACGQGTAPSSADPTNGKTSSVSAAGSVSGSSSAPTSSSSRASSSSAAAASGSTGSGTASSSSSVTISTSSSSSVTSSSSTTGNTRSDAGTDSGSGSACPGADPSEFALVESWLNDKTAAGALPGYAYTNITKNFPAGATFDRLACSIAMSCVEWAPMESNWLRQCEAVLTSAIVAESSYVPSEVVTDTYATRSLTDGTIAKDPTVGLLQIRFSSTVHDFNYYGPMAKMAAIGCSWPGALTTQTDSQDFWATQGATTTYLAFMQDVACNIGLASWYYFYNATGNGGASAVYIAQYCAGNGTAGTMVDGLLSHLEGGAYPRPADDTNAYPWGIECCACGNPSVCTCAGCTGRFAALMGIGTSASRPSPDPFLQTLAPEPSKYCK
jgi:hypothetical protein